MVKQNISDLKMLNWEINNEVIGVLNFNGKNLINPWGLETADSSAFFSLEKGIGYRYSVLDEKYSTQKNAYSGYKKVRMREGLWEVNFSDEIVSSACIKRKATLKCIEDSYFMDFVMRFRIKKEFIEYALIANQKFFHVDSNIYHQYPVDQVLLKGVEKDLFFKILIEDKSVPRGMSPYMYVRDRGDEWIIHVRMLPASYDKKVIKLCNSWYKTRPLPKLVSNLLLKNPKIENQLWYRGEFSPFSSKLMRFLNPAAFPMVKLKKGTELMWDVSFKILRRA